MWDLQVIPLDSPVAEPAQVDPELENAFICHLQDHWFCIRKVNGEWYNFDSLYAAPQHLSKFYLAAYLDSLKGSGWSIFLVRGNFPKEFPISSSEASNGFGQWLLPEDAERITKSCNSVQQAPQQERAVERQQFSNQFLSPEEAELFSDMEDEDLKAAIAASLMDSTPIATNIAEASNPQNNDKQKSIQVETIEASVPPTIDESNKHVEANEAGTLLNDKNNQQVASSLGGDDSERENQNKEKILWVESSVVLFAPDLFLQLRRIIYIGLVGQNIYQWLEVMVLCSIHILTWIAWFILYCKENPSTC